MEILFRRSQKSGQFRDIKFQLWSKIELDENERDVVRRYAFDRSVLIDSDQPELIRKSVYTGLAALVLAAAILSAFTSYNLAMLFGLVAGAAVGYFYYDKNRETVYVKDLLHGRFFDCGSVIELARKEAWLETIAGFLRQVMESAKHWDGTHRSEIEVLPKDQAKQLIIKGL